MTSPRTLPRIFVVVHHFLLSNVKMRKKQSHPMKASRKYRTYSPEALTDAYIAVVERGLPVKTAARQFNVPHNTLRDSVKGRIDPETVKSGPPPLLTLEEEAKFLAHINHMASLGYGYTVQEVIDKASTYAVHLGKRQRDDPLTSKWFDGFRSRWNMKVLKPRSLANCRAKSLNKDATSKYFEDLETVLKTHNLLDKPQCIYNFDEKGVQTETKAPFIVSQITKIPSISASRSAITTILGCGNALGTQIPPYFVFKGKRMNQNLLEGSTAGSEGTVSDSGWSNSGVFLHYLQNHFLKYVQRDSQDQPLLLLFDGHKSHINLPVIQWAQANNIIMFVLPAHTSHALQPLDVGCFGPLQKIYDFECHKQLRDSPQTVITRYNVAAIASKAYVSALSVTNLRSAFAKTGVYPFNSNAMCEEQFIPSAAFAEPAQISVESSDDAASETNTRATEPATSATNSRTTEPVAPKEVATKPCDAQDIDCFFQVSEKCFVDKQVHNLKNKKSEITISGLVSGKEITHESIVSEMKKSEQKKAQKPLTAKRKNATETKKSKKAKVCPTPSTSGLHIQPKIVRDDDGMSDYSDDMSEISESEKCCVCHRFEPKELRECVSLVFAKWGKCDFDGCEHWTHLKFCCRTTVLRRHDTFFCPCHDNQTEE